MVVQLVPGSILAFCEALRQSESLEQVAAWPCADKHVRCGGETQREYLRRKLQNVDEDVCV